MNEVLDQVSAWLVAGHQVVTATLVRVRKSAPRMPGAVMAVNSAGEVAGSVSGGCVESALYEEAQEVLASGTPRYLTFGIADDEAFAVGLTCGGTIEVFLERLDWFSTLGVALANAIREQRPVAMAVIVSGPGLGARLLIDADRALGSTGAAGLDAALVAEARAMLRQGQTGVRSFGPGGEHRRDEVTCFIQSFAPPPRMFVFGAIDFAVAAVRMGKFLGYRVTLCDARPVFATRARFPEADEVVVAWPHEFLARAEVGPRDAILVLTHDSKFDVPVLVRALRTEAGFIGALGSRATHEKRYRELLEEGVSAVELERICSPVGLDIGGRTPEETAISIAAEIIARQNGRPGGRLSQATGRIHNEGLEAGVQ
jgi:xanthine dehydrogenase accessory factor